MKREVWERMERISLMGTRTWDQQLGRGTFVADRNIGAPDGRKSSIPRTELSRALLDLRSGQFGLGSGEM